jgi:hypothetical protein
MLFMWLMIFFAWACSFLLRFLFLQFLSRFFCYLFFQNFSLFPLLLILFLLFIFPLLEFIILFVCLLKNLLMMLWLAFLRFGWFKNSLFFFSVFQKLEFAEDFPQFLKTLFIYSLNSIFYQEYHFRHHLRKTYLFLFSYY